MNIEEKRAEISARWHEAKQRETEAMKDRLQANRDRLQAEQDWLEILQSCSAKYPPSSAEAEREPEFDGQAYADKHPDLTGDPAPHVGLRFNAAEIRSDVRAPEKDSDQ